MRAWVEESWQRWSPEIETALKRAWGAVPGEWQRRMLPIADFATEPTGRRSLLAALLGLVVALVVLRTVRGRGDLVVCIAYPDDLRGSFTVTLSHGKPRTGRAPRGEREATHGKVSSRTEHYLVARETQFRGLTPGRYWITVDGDLFSGSGDEPIEQPFESQLIHVRSRDTHRLEFDLRPRSCPVEVRVVWDRQTVRECTISAHGRPDTLRHTRGQSVRIGLPMGRHVIAVGSGDRVAEREVDVDDYATRIVEVDLGVSEGVLFKGCPPAVAPYLQGDVPIGRARARARGTGQGLEPPARADARRAEQPLARGGALRVRRALPAKRLACARSSRTGRRRLRSTRRRASPCVPATCTAARATRSAPGRRTKRHRSSTARSTATARPRTRTV